METASKRLSKISEGGKQVFFSALKSEVIKSPLASNVLLGLILTGLEKVVDVEFACPCDPRWNALFASAYFILPGGVAAVLMLVIKCKVHQEQQNLPLFGVAPIIMWLVLVFLDGQYFACAKTNWSGRFVIVDKAEPQRWCEPANSTSSMERMSLTQRWYFQSQFIGIVVPLGGLIVFGAYKGCKMLCREKPEKRERQPDEPVKEEELEKL